MSEISISGLSPETAEAMQPQMAPHSGLEKALSIIDRANAMRKTASKENEKRYKAVRRFVGPLAKGATTALFLSQLATGKKVEGKWPVRGVAALGGSIVAADAMYMNHLANKKKEERKARMKKMGMASPAQSLKNSQQVGRVGSQTTSKAPSVKAQTSLPPKLGSAMPKIKLAAYGEDELNQALSRSLSRETARAQADAMFSTSNEWRNRDGALLRKLFLMTPASTSQSTAIKTAGPMGAMMHAAHLGHKVGELKEKLTPPARPPVPPVLKTANIDRALAKIASEGDLTDAQRRYPELLEVRRK